MYFVVQEWFQYVLMNWNVIKLTILSMSLLNVYFTFWEYFARNGDWLVNWLIVSCCSSCSRIFRSFRDVTIDGKVRRYYTFGFWARKDLYRATPALTWNIGFYRQIRRTLYFLPITIIKGSEYLVLTDGASYGDFLFGCLFGDFSPPREFFTHLETSPLR